MDFVGTKCLIGLWLNSSVRVWGKKIRGSETEETAHTSHRHCNMLILCAQTQTEAGKKSISV